MFRSQSPHLGRARPLLQKFLVRHSDFMMTSLHHGRMVSRKFGPPRPSGETPEIFLVPRSLSRFLSAHAHDAPREPFQPLSYEATRGHSLERAAQAFLSPLQCRLDNPYRLLNLPSNSGPCLEKWAILL